ncbi:Panacea domain-containing protein [Enterococcus asini]|uniref:Panacea domain-containing protein n=1 Tax=Enterococcus asini TaxID=57732 RepID=UPI001E5DF2A5|nr:type II toxin-antitoxin system antitoxin SocA domain-containing protein [Enterococcus asini]MCD5030188.1 DUF4065 domain-containing protein [Enterococcus asini]
MCESVVFDDIRVLIKYISQKSTRPMTPLRIQKTLYFLFAFYGATYGKLNSSNEEENKFEGLGEQDYPKYLFKEEFEAWNYGPVIRSVYKMKKYNPEELEDADGWNIETEIDKNIQDLLNQVIEQTDELGDFQLVERSHEDMAWKNAFEQGQPTMKKELIIGEYAKDVF